MLKPQIALAIIATLCYAVSGVITERYSNRLHVLWMLVLNNGFMFAITLTALSAMAAVKQPLEMKVDWRTFLAISFIGGTVLFAANYAFYQAFREGGTLPEIATILCLLPIFSTALRHLFVPQDEEPAALPSAQVMIGTSLIIAGILLIAFQAKPTR